MKKYTTTKEHGWMMAGIILSVNSGHKISLYDGSILGVSKEKFSQWISDGWVTNIQAPNWTDDDMQNYAIYCYSIPFGSEFTIEGWQKERS